MKISGQGCDENSGDSSAPAILGRAPLDVRLKRLPETRYKLRELNERWNNRLVFERLSVREAYLGGNLAVALIVQVSRAPLGKRHPARKHK